MIIIGDTHIQTKNINESDNIFSEIYSYCPKGESIVHLGDYYHSNRPTAEELAFGTKWALKFHQVSGKKFYMLRGNHPMVNYKDNISSVEYLSYLGINIVEDLVIDNIYFAHKMTEKSDMFFGVDVPSNARYDVLLKDLKKYKQVWLGHQHCVSLDTKILTENGWKTYNSLSLKEKVATFNLKKGIIEYQYPINKYKYNYKGKMINFIHDKWMKINILVTPQHRMILNRSYKELKPCVKFADQITSQKILLNIQSERWKYPIKHTFKNKYWAELIGFIIGDGHYARGRKNNLAIGISQKEGRNTKDYLPQLIKKCKLYYTVSGKDRKTFRISWTHEENTKFLNWMKKNVPNKKLNRLLVSLPSEQLKKIYKGLIQSDGHWYTNTLQVFGQKDYKTIELFEELCLKLGKKFSTESGNFGAGFRPNNEFYRVSICNKRVTKIRKTNIKQVNYKGIVWCPETPNGTWIAKRDGKAFITGNSFQKITDKVFHLGSMLFTTFAELKVPKKYIAKIKKTTKLIELTTPVAIREVNSVSELSNIDANTKVRIRFKDFDTFKKEVGQISRYKGKFHELKIKCDFKNLIDVNQNVVSQNKDEIINNWLNAIKNREIQSILKDEFQNIEV